jgi:hypothetical protein
MDEKQGTNPDPRKSSSEMTSIADEAELLLQGQKILLESIKVRDHVNRALAHGIGKRSQQLTRNQRRAS